MATTCVANQNNNLPAICQKAALLLIMALSFLASKEVAAFLPRRKGCFRSFTITPSSPVVSAKRLQQQQQQQQHTIEWETANGRVSFSAQDGETLRTAALRSGVISPHNGRSNVINCRGLGTCGTCAVEIFDHNKIEPTKRNTKERLRLSFPPHNSDSPLRLACQVQVRGDLHVVKRTGFWGQKDEIAEVSEPSQPFGELEFLLDNKSPPPRDCNDKNK